MTETKKSTGNDRLLVEACIGKDMTAWAALVTKYSPLMTLTIANRLHRCGISLPRQDIDDIRQHILTDLWSKGSLATVRGRDDIAGWIAIVSANAAVAYVRRKKNTEPRHHLPLAKIIDDPALAELFCRDTAEAPDALYRQECAGKIEEAIARLPARERLVMTLHLVHEKKFDEIARMLHMPPGTVASCVKRTKEKLRRMLRDIDPRR